VRWISLALLWNGNRVLNSTMIAVPTNAAGLTLAEVSQDGAGIVKTASDIPHGFYTESIQTCVAYAFECLGGFCVYHDTGQLKLGTLVDIIAALGKVERVQSAQCSRSRWKMQDAEHEKRKLALFKKLAFRGKEVRFDAPEGSILFLRNGETFTEFEKPSNSILPQRERRIAINTLNNMFSPANSQSIPVDIQSVDGEFSPLPSLMLTLSDIEKRANFELMRGDRDYINQFLWAKHVGAFA
jgi:hypothetical protein